MSANRLAALAAFLVSLSALIAAVAGAFPGKYAGALVAAAALIAKTATVVKFLDGAQKSEALQPRTPVTISAQITPPAPTGIPTSRPTA